MTDRRGAQVLVNTITTARDVERSMLEAHKAAAQAKLSHKITQRSVCEAGKLFQRFHGDFSTKRDEGRLNGVP